ncbi:MAG TPA: transposase [Candidatus Binatia bacterium]
MARKPRVEYAGAFYHVICRGNQSQVIFGSNADRKYYLERLEEYRQRYEFKVYAYVLMSNHIHLLIETGEVALSKIMQGLQQKYTRYYNHKYKKVGHLFQGRYKAILCDRQAYLLELVRYLHLNPGRMRAPMDPWKYPWSSHAAYLGKSRLVRINTWSVLGELNRSVGQARRAYLRFMAEGKGAGHQPNYYDVWDQRILGDKNFVEQIDEKIRIEREIKSPGPRAKLSKLLRLTAHAYHVTERDLVRPGRQRRWVKPRAALVYLAREWGRASVKEIGRRLHRDPSIISRLYSAYAADRDPNKEMWVAKQLER